MKKNRLSPTYYYSKGTGYTVFYLLQEKLITVGVCSVKIII